MWTKYLLKLKIYCGYNLRKIILFLKEYFPSNSFTLITLWKMTMTFFWFRKSIEGHKWFIPQWPYWMTKKVCSSSFFFFFPIYRTYREIWWSFFCCETPFPVRSYLWIFSLDFPFWIFLIPQFSPSWSKTPLFIGEDREFEFQIPKF